MMTAEVMNDFNRSFDPLRNRYISLYGRVLDELNLISKGIEKGKIAYIGNRLETPNMKLYNGKIEICNGDKVSKTIYIECFGIASDSIATVEYACHCMEEYLDRRVKEPEYKAEISYDNIDNEEANEND